MHVLFIRSMDVSLKHYTVKNYGIHEIVLLDTCLLYLYLPPEWVRQYLVTYHNNGTHISSAVTHNVQRYKETLLPWPCLYRYCKLDNHEVVLHSYRFKKYNWIFQQTFCFANCDFYFWDFSDDNRAMLTRKDAYFWKIHNTHNHK